MLLIKNTHMIDPASGTDARKDILIQDDKIIKIADSVTEKEAAVFSGEEADMLQVIDAGGIDVYKRQQEELENIGFFPIPATEAKDSIAYTETPTGFVVPKEGKKVDLAVQIVGELVTKEAMTEYYKMHQGIPAVNGVDVKLDVYKRQGIGIPFLCVGGKIIFYFAEK